MSDRGDERPDRSRGAVLTAVASSALAAFSVLALVGVLVLVFGQDDAPAGPAGRSSARSAGIPDPVAASPEARSGSPGAGSGRDGPAGAPPAGSAAAPAGSRTARVVVLNATSRVGAAAALRDVLTEGGWKVTRVGDFDGRVPATTVFFPPALQQAAVALEKQFDEVNRIRRAPDRLATGRLTVILGKDFSP